MLLFEYYVVMFFMFSVHASMLYMSESVNAQKRWNILE